MDQTQLVELVTEQDTGITRIGQRDSGVFAFVEWEFGIKIDGSALEALRPIEDTGRGTPVHIVVHSYFLQLLDYHLRDDNLVSGQTTPEWIRLFTSDDSETDEPGGICDEY